MPCKGLKRRVTLRLLKNGTKTKKHLEKYVSNILSWLNSFYKEPLQIKEKNSCDSEKKINGHLSFKIFIYVFIYLFESGKGGEREGGNY